MRPKILILTTSLFLATASVRFLSIQCYSQVSGNRSCCLYGHCTTMTSEREGSNLLVYRHDIAHPDHSTIVCQMDDSESDFDRRCHLQNVCWDRRESIFVYFSDPDGSNESRGATTLPNGKPRNISVRRNRGELGYIDEYLPLVDRAGPIPLANSTFSNHKVHVYFTSFWAENFGHALVDDIHPLYALMYAFNMATRDSVFLYPREIADNLYGSDKERGSKFLYELADLLSENGLLRMDTHPNFSSLPRIHSGPHLICMRHLLAGSGNLENLNLRPTVNLIGSWPSFIGAILTGWRQELGIESREEFPPPIQKQLIIFIRKAGRRRFINLDMLVEKSRGQFPVETLVINPGEMTIIEQISIAQRATVTFSPCGGISFFNSFLRDGATAIIADYWDLHRNVSASMEGHLWDRVLGHQTLRYMVKESEITIEHPGNSSARNWVDYRDFGATMLDLSRAMQLIDHALYIAEHTFQLEKHSIE